MFRLLLPIAACLSLLAQPADQSRSAPALEHLNRGAAHLRKNENQQAIRELKKAVALDPKSAVAHQFLGQAYLALSAIEMVAEAKAEFQQALDLDPNLLWPHFYLAKIHFDLGRYEKAKAELEQGLGARPNVPHFLSLLGEVYRRLGKPDLAIDLNRKALAADPSMTPAHYYLALAYLDLKQEEEATRELESAVRSKYVIPEMYVTLGEIRAKKGKLAEAADLYRKAIAVDPSRSEGHVKLAEVYRMQGDPDRALQQLRLASAGTERALSSEYLQRLRVDYHFELGRVYEDKSMVEAAIQAYRKVLDLDPDHRETHRRLAGIFERQGDRTRALDHASRAEKPIEPGRIQ